MRHYLKNRVSVLLVDPLYALGVASDESSTIESIEGLLRKKVVEVERIADAASIAFDEGSCWSGMKAKQQADVCVYLECQSSMPMPSCVTGDSGMPLPRSLFYTRFVTYTPVSHAKSNEYVLCSVGTN